MRMMFLGCGFLASHFIPQVLPHAEHIILVDHDRIEKGNYDNHLLPKGYTGKRKIMALASLIQVLSSVSVTPVNLKIKSVKQLFDLNEEFKPDLSVCTFDNVIARVHVREFAVESGTPVLFAGVTEGYIYIDWAETVVLPSPDDEKVRRELERIRDICSRAEFRGLGVLAAGLMYYVFEEWKKGRKIAVVASTKDGINIKLLNR